MKLVFEGIEDMLVDLPRFMRLLAGEGSLSERITFSLGEKAAKAIAERMSTQSPAPAADPAPAEAKPKKNTTKKAKAPETATEPVSEASAEETPPFKEDKPMNEPDPTPEESPKVTETQVKQALSGLMKSRKDAVKKILNGHGAANLTKLAPEHYADVLEQAKKYKAMRDEEYKEALKG